MPRRRASPLTPMHEARVGGFRTACGGSAQPPAPRKPIQHHLDRPSPPHPHPLPPASRGKDGLGQQTWAAASTRKKYCGTV